jgi:hypothetical protein
MIMTIVIVFNIKLISMFDVIAVPSFSCIINYSKLVKQKKKKNKKKKEKKEERINGCGNELYSTLLRCWRLHRQ